MMSGMMSELVWGTQYLLCEDLTVVVNLGYGTGLWEGHKKKGRFRPWLGSLVG